MASSFPFFLYLHDFNVSRLARVMEWRAILGAKRRDARGVGGNEQGDTGDGTPLGSTVDRLRGWEVEGGGGGYSAVFRGMLAAGLLAG